MTGPATQTAALQSTDDLPARRGRVHAIVATARPRQWLKNLLVIAAAGAAGALGRDDVPGRVCLACAAFCMLASGIYAINDVRDADEDRLHPRKCRRPVAAGELAPRAAAIAGIGSIFAGLLLCTAIRPLLGLVALAYVTLTVSYTMLWRHVVVLDVVAIAGGFVLRAVAGGVSAPVTLSKWFLLVVTFAAILVAAGKRHAELRRPGTHRQTARRVLRTYSEPVLRAIIMAAGIAALLAYIAWAFELPLVGGIPWRPLTILPFAAAILRYGALVAAGDGEAPEDLILGDRMLRLLSIAWLVLFVAGVNASV